MHKLLEGAIGMFFPLETDDDVRLRNTIGLLGVGVLMAIHPDLETFVNAEEQMKQPETWLLGRIREAFHNLEGYDVVVLSL